MAEKPRNTAGEAITDSSLRNWYSNLAFPMQLGLLILPLLVGTVILAAVIGVQLTDAEREAVLDRLDNEARDIQELVEAPFTSLDNDLVYLQTETAAFDYAQAHNSTSVTAENQVSQQEAITSALSRLPLELQAFMQGRPLYSQIRLLDLDGNELVAVARMDDMIQIRNDLTDVRLSNIYRQGRNLQYSGQLWWSDVRLQADAGSVQRPMLQLVMPLSHQLADEQLVGYLTFDLNLEVVFRYVEAVEVEGGFAYLVDAEGFFLAHSLASEQTILFGRDTDQGEQLSGSVGNEILTGRPVLDLPLSHDNDSYIGATAVIHPLQQFEDSPNLPIWTVVVAEPEAEVVGQVQIFVLLFVLGLIALALVTGSLFWWQGSVLNRRLAAVQGGLQRVYRGELTHKLPVQGRNAFSDTATEFNRMTDRLDSLVVELEGRVRARIRDLELVSEISGEMAELRDLDLVLNRAINRIVERFEFYHAQVFLVDDVRENAVLVASTGEPGHQLLATGHKLAVGSDSVIGRVTTLGITVIAGDTQSSDVPWRPNAELPDTRSEMALPLKAEDIVIGALDIQSSRPDAFAPSDIEIFQVLADQLAIAINNARLIENLQSSIESVNTLNQRLTQKVWVDFAENDPRREPLSYRYNLLEVEPVVGRNGPDVSEPTAPTYSAAIEVAGNQIGQIEAKLPDDITDEEQVLIESVAARVGLAIDNARLVQETQRALGEAQRLYEMARAVNSAADLEAQDIYALIVDQLTFEESLDQIAVLLAGPIPSYLATHLTVEHLWYREGSREDWAWEPGQHLDYLRRGLARLFTSESRELIYVEQRVDARDPHRQVMADMMNVLDADALLLIPLVTGARWFGLLVCGSRTPMAFGENFRHFARAAGDQMTVAIDNRRLFVEVQDEARRALALAEAGQLVSQIGGDFGIGVDRLFRAVSGPGEFDRWWFGLLEPNGYEVRRLIAAAPEFPDVVDLRTDHSTLTETIHLRQVILVNEFDQPHPVLGEISSEIQRVFGKHMAVPVMVGGEKLLGALLIGRDVALRDFDERDMQLVSTLASQLAVAAENLRLFTQIEDQRQTLRSTLETMQAGVLVLSSASDIVLLNEQAVDLLGPGARVRMFTDETYPMYRVGTNEPVAADDFPAARVLQYGEPVIAENFYVVSPEGHRTDMLVNAAPIRSENEEITAAVVVLQEITELRELELALQTSLSETTALYEASRSIAAVTTSNELAAILLEQVKTLNPDQVIVLLQGDQEQSDRRQRVAAVWPTTDPKVLKVEQLKIPSNLLMPDDILVVEATEPAVREAAGVYSLATMPLKARGGRTLGWLTIAYHREHLFRPEQRRFLSTLADQAAVALDVNRLFESTQQALRSVANLYRGSKRISEVQGINEAITVVQEELQSFKPARVDLLLQRSPEDPEDIYLALAWSIERSLEMIPALPIDPVDLTSQAHFDVMSREEYYIQDMMSAPGNDLHQALRDLDTPYRAVLSIPLRVSGRTVGRLAIGFLEPRQYTPDDQQFISMLADAIAYIVENELLFQQTQDSLEETGVLYQASQAIASAEQREEIVQAMIDYAASAVVDKVMLVTLLGADWEASDALVEVSVTWGRGEFLDLKGLRFSREQLPIWDQLASPYVVWSDDVENDASLDDNTRLGCYTLDIVSYVVVPLQTPGHPIGAIILASSQPRVHQDREIRIYQSLADQAAVQLENKRLFEQAELRARQLATSAEVSRAVTSILNQDDLFPRIVNLIRDSFGYDHAQIFMIDDLGERAVLQSATGEAGRQMLEIRHSLPIGSRSVVGQATVQGIPFLVNDTSEADVMHRPNPYLPDTRSELAIPLNLKGRVVGVIDVQANRPTAFTEDDIQVLTSLADQLAIAIDNAQLFDISLRRASEMSFLFDVTAATASASDLSVALETAASILIRQLKGQEVAIFLYDRVANGLKPEVVIEARHTEEGVEYHFVEIDYLVRMGQGTIGWVAERRQPLRIDNLLQDSRYRPGLSLNNSGLYVPLLVGDELLGVLGMEGAQAGQFDENDLRLMQTLSTTLTAIIQNVQLVEELQHTNERLREIDQLKTNFLAAMSHELRTPLNSIIGFSRVILKGIDGPITDMQEQDIQTIHDSGKHLLGLVNDILDQAKIEAGKMELVKEYFNLGTVIQSVMASAKGLTKDRPVQLFTEIEDSLPPAFGDEFRSRQILINIISNAAKFTHQGSITVSAYGTRDEDTDQRVIMVSVTDTGIGIDEKNIAGIFESFQQVDNTTTRTAEGTGLGLPLARSLTELQGGTIWVESEVGLGSTFYITIPTSPPETEDETDISASVEASEEEVEDPTWPVHPGRKIVLAVDDELGMINLYRRYLNKEGWQVIGTTDPEKTEEMVAVHHPQLILLDINMPNRDGWTILEMLKQWDEAREIPVIVCSIDTNTQRSGELGATRHLVKPFEEADLLKAVEDSKA